MFNLEILVVKLGRLGKGHQNNFERTISLSTVVATSKYNFCIVLILQIFVAAVFTHFLQDLSILYALHRPMDPRNVVTC
jgi:hypothetical protein